MATSPVNPLRDAAAAALLGSEFTPSWQALQELLPRLEGYRYDFMDPAEYGLLIGKSISRGMAVYWREILHRAHWAASASLIRTHRWFCGLFDAFASRNLIVFCACARGLLESTWYSLSGVAATLASAKQTVLQALEDRLDHSVPVEEVENLLIHFNYARKPAKGETVPDQHEALTISAYLKQFGPDEQSIRKFYAELCDVVHPGATSIVSYAGQMDECGSKIVLTLEREPQVLQDFAKSLRLAMPVIMATGFNIGVMTLYTLNAFPANEIHTPYINSLPLKRLPALDYIDQLLRKP